MPNNGVVEELKKFIKNVHKYAKNLQVRVEIYLTTGFRVNTGKKCGQKLSIF